MWLKHEGFNGLVSQSWEADVVGSKQFSLCSKPKRLKPPLKSLNKQAFGHISRRAMEAKEEYGLVMKQVVLDPNNQSLLDDADIKRKRANFLLDAELAFYQQKAKCDFLMNSGRCTSYFHSIVKKNRRKNTVGFLVREDGSKTTSKDEVANIFVDYFTTLFGTTSSVESIELEILAAGTRIPSSAQATLLASVTPEEVLMDALDHFSRVSGLTLNPTKSNIFLAGKYRDASQNILDLASFPRGQLPVRYLGLPLASQRISESDFAPLFKTVDGFLSKWSTLKLSYAGRLELIRAVVQGVQSFWLQAFPVQKYVLDRITSMCRAFLWGSKLAKVAWVDICKPRAEGGLGLKDANTWNNALLCKLLWNLAAKKDTLWVKWVHNVYIQGENLWQWQPKKRHSVFFKRLAYVRELLVQKLGDHYPSMEEAMIPFSLAGNLIPRKVYDLFRVKANPKPWMAFIWQSYIPLKCSFTMWLALRRRLPTKTNLEFLGLPMDCTFCGHGLEDVDHLFFSCQFSKEVWDNIKTWLGMEGHLSTLTRTIRWLKAFRRGDGILKKARRTAFACSVFHL
ncbi:unnamed protein product [Cuscuta campestris]|uniref:Reverse transcriptase zinc-binding domain-containing protein n=1 Tax=Cuscuta campestris TaxID=132261 RepID=A0A484MRJ0_9ASTE|nr:unnamed protein product [Cuscuta campestris]